MPLPDGVAELIPSYLARQRWYGGAGIPSQWSVISAEELAARDGHRLLRVVVEADRERYQLLVGERPNGEVAEFLKGHEAAVLGPAGASYYYDAALDHDLALVLLEVVSGGAERASRVRPITAEQSNTSLVYDDRIILKVFRRLHAGRNPDVEVTTALAAAGFDHVAPPVAVCADEYGDLAFAQRFLAGGSDGWALALTSLRDLYADGSADPEAAGGDFAGEAGRWAGLIASVEARLADAVAALGGGLTAPAERFVALLHTVREQGPGIRVHGDYHLGQVMWTDSGWYVLDFEGEPARPLAERAEPCSPLKDVAGMVRSFHYASRAALGDRSEEEVATLEPAATAWELRNRNAFLTAYRATPGITALLPDSEANWELVLAAYEMDKALYELDYERAYRPDWEPIPLRAVARLLAG